MQKKKAMHKVQQDEESSGNSDNESDRHMDAITIKLFNFNSKDQ